jgi:hypothetical protein
LGARSLAVREVRSDEEMLSRLQQSPSSIAAIEFRPEFADRIVERLWYIERMYPQARSAILADRAWATYAPLAFSSGARAFVTTPRQLAMFARFAHRHLEAVRTAGSRADGLSNGDTAAPHTDTVASVLDELFDDLTESDDRWLIQRSAARLNSWLPRSKQ